MCQTITTQWLLEILPALGIRAVGITMVERKDPVMSREFRGRWRRRICLDSVKVTSAIWTISNSSTIALTVAVKPSATVIIIMQITQITETLTATL